MTEFLETKLGFTIFIISLILIVIGITWIEDIIKKRRKNERP